MEKETNPVKGQLTENNGGVTADNIAAWKNLHGRIQEVYVDDAEAGVRLTGYFKRPDMKTMQAVSAISKSNEVRGGELLFDNCWLGGAQELKDDAIYKMSGIAALSELFGKCTHRLKNL